jgi:hypothetical protein
MSYKVVIIFTLSACLFFAPLVHGKVLVLTDDPYFKGVQRSEDSLSGNKSLQVFSRNLHSNKIEGWDFDIKQKPVKDNEFRYMLIAWKQKGGKSLMIQLANKGKWGGALSYVTGNPGDTLLEINLAPHSPDNWDIVIRDVYKDMIASQFERNFNHNSSLKELTITGIALTPWDGEYGLFDKIILGTDLEELTQIANSLQGASVDPLGATKQQWDKALYDRYDWEAVAIGFSKIEQELTSEQKSFFARDVSLANAWLALENFAKGSNNEGSTYYKKAQKYLSGLGLPSGTWGLSYLKNLFLQKTSRKNIKPAYVEKIALVVVPKVKTDTLEDAFDPGEYRKFLLEWNIIKTFIEKNSDGKLSIETEFLLVDGFYGKLNDNGKVDVTTIEPYPENILKKAAKDFDVVVYYSPTLGVSSGGTGHILLNAAPTYSSKRGVIILNRGHTNPDDFILPLHELAHVYESFLGLKTVHAFRSDPNYSKAPLRAELSYYEKLFHELIPQKVKNDWLSLSWHSK